MHVGDRDACTGDGSGSAAGEAGCSPARSEGGANGVRCGSWQETQNSKRSLVRWGRSAVSPWKTEWSRCGVGEDRRFCLSRFGWRCPSGHLRGGGERTVRSAMRHSCLHLGFTYTWMLRTVKGVGCQRNGDRREETRGPSLSTFPSVPLGEEGEFSKKSEWKHPVT